MYVNPFFSIQLPDNLFRTTKSLLCEPSEVSFPKDIAPDDLANDFGNFLMQKIDKINQLIDMQSSLEMSKAGEKGCADSDLSLIHI